MKSLSVYLFVRRMVCGVLLLSAWHTSAQTQQDHSHNHDNHAAHAQAAPATPLQEAGNDVFGTVQEIIARLKADPNTDWKQVNLDGLRSHLLDMHDMSINTEVVSKKPVKKGLMVIVQPTTDRAKHALRRVFSAHPSQLKKETDWDMVVEEKDAQFVITVTANKATDVAEIQGLGYIGVMAYGAHHQLHHWAIATGTNPHHAH